MLHTCDIVLYFIFLQCTIGGGSMEKKTRLCGQMYGDTSPND